MKKSWMLVLVMVLAIACKTNKLVSETEKTSSRDSVYVTKEKVKVSVPESSLRFAGKIMTFPRYVFVNGDSVKCPDAEFIPTTISEDNKDGLSGKITVDRTGNIVANCDQKAKEYITEIERLNKVLILEKEIVRKYKEENTRLGDFIQSVKNGGSIFLILVVLLLLVLLKKSIS